MHLWCSLLACQVRVTVGDSGLCCCVRTTSFERLLTPLSAALKKKKKKMGMGVGEEVSKSLGVLRPVNLYGYISAIKKKKKK